jgi:ribonucleoside-diphosphate reductase alpha chain
LAITKIRKRDGRLQAFNIDKIASAIQRSLDAVGEHDTLKISKRLSEKVVAALDEKGHKGIPSVEDIQDIVEKTLIENNLAKAAKAYILYRSRHQEIRDYKRLIGVNDDLKLDVNATKVLERRYLRRDENGKVIETPRQLFERVAHSVVTAERIYGGGESRVSAIENEFFQMMSGLEFLPNSPTLMNAGAPLGQLAACFVIPIEDSIRSIFDAVKATAIIHQSGGGTGFSFSKLRPKGDFVKSTGGVASGPISFMKIFDVTTEQIKQGGKRRGANMAVLSVYHPDIVEFITSKKDTGALNNFNISVAVDENFMRAAMADKKITLTNPRNGEPTQKVSASQIFQLITSQAWETGDPGLIFLDTMNKTNPTPELGQFEATNPCGEQPLLPYESCNLGSINLNKFIDKGGEVDWSRLAQRIRYAIRFLDDVIDVNKYPLNQIAHITRANRKIGLGVMGFAEMLIMLKIRYDSHQAVFFAEKLAKFFESQTHEASKELARQRRPFPNFKGSIWARNDGVRIRNATTTTIAPTGTISIIAGCSSGIEPLFAVAFVRDVMEGTKLLEVNPIFERIARERGFFSTDLLAQISEMGSIRHIEEIPRDVRDLFVTALDISPEWHVRIQAAFQKHTDNAVSKTINLPSDSTIEEVKQAYLLAWRLKCKGITVYRYGSKPNQVLQIGPLEKERQEKHIVADSEFSGGCFGTTCTF